MINDIKLQMSGYYMVKKVQYDILKKLGNIEIREYPKLLLASVHNEDDSTAFRILFNYISGNNKSNKGIEMTAPVVSSGELENESLIISSDHFFTFVMPDKYNRENLPEPNDSRINIHLQEEKVFAVLRFSGRTNEQMVKQKQDDLTNLLSKNNYKMKGKPFLMRYNSQIMPGFLRTNEAGIEILM